MKRFISVLLAGLIGFGLFGCSEYEESSVLNRGEIMFSDSAEESVGESSALVDSMGESSSATSTTLDTTTQKESTTTESSTTTTSTKATTTETTITSVKSTTTTTTTKVATTTKTTTTTKITTTTTTTTTKAAQERVWVLNTNTFKFHYESCSSVDTIKPEHVLVFEGTYQQCVDMGYSPCGRCKPKG